MNEKHIIACSNLVQVFAIVFTGNLAQQFIKIKFEIRILIFIYTM